MSNIKNKSILLLCKENTTFAMYFLAERLLLDNNNVDFFFVNHFETYLNSSDINKFTYFKVKEDFQDCNVFDLNDVVDEFIGAIESSKTPDYNYLRYLEDNYTKFKSLQCQLLTSQMFNCHLHDRFYFSKISIDLQLLFLELLYKYIIRFFDNNKFDFIFDIDISELPRAIIVEVAEKRRIEYFSIEHSRYKNYKLPTLATKWWNPKFESFLEESPIIISNSKNEDLDRINEYLEIDNILGSEYKIQPIFQINIYSVYLKLKDFSNVFFYSLKLDLIARNFLVKKKSKILFHGTLKFIIFYFLSFFRRFYLLYISKLFTIPGRDSNYFYMPLHLVPESSTFNLAPFYTNELFIIEQISKSLPINTQLYVKEHPAMIGDRNLGFYKKIRQMPNVVLVSPKAFGNQKSVILNSLGVITISGTSAFEAAMLGKGALIFGDVPFDSIKGIYKIKNFEEITSILPLLNEIDNRASLLNYINTVTKFGIEVNISLILINAERKIKNDKLEDSLLDLEIGKLLCFFSKAIESSGKN